MRNDRLTLTGTGLNVSGNYTISRKVQMTGYEGSSFKDASMVHPEFTRQQDTNMTFDSRSPVNLAGVINGALYQRFIPTGTNPSDVLDIDSSNVDLAVARLVGEEIIRGRGYRSVNITGGSQ